MHKCDLCNEVRDCAPKVIGDKEYEICLECWKALEEKLKGKGKDIRTEPVIMLPDPRESRQREDEEPQFPGEPPIIWSGSEHA